MKTEDKLTTKSVDIGSKSVDELKTLKEIYGNKANGQVSVKQLRQNAIKKIKLLKKVDTDFSCDTTKREQEFKEQFGFEIEFDDDFWADVMIRFLINSMMHDYNLTEDDLK